MPDVVLSDLLTVPQVAERLGTTNAVVNGLVKNRQIRYFKVGKSRPKFREQDVQEYLEKRCVFDPISEDED